MRFKWYMTEIIKPGPKPIYDFNSYQVGDEIVLQPIKQSSFKSMLSKFNKGRADKHQYRYEQIKRVIVAIRNK